MFKNIISKLKDKNKKPMKEQECCMAIAKSLKSIYDDGKISLVQSSSDTFIMFECSKLSILLTVCITGVDSSYCVKIEEIYVEEKCRGKGVMASTLEVIKGISDENKCKVGLWVDKNNENLYNFYIRNGFKYIETLDDIWVEYN